MELKSTFASARDFLLRHRTDYASAYAGFKWPVLHEFNWALDHFDVMARDNLTTALHIVEEDGCEVRRSYSQLAARSSQVANFLRAAGVARGDRVLILLGNELALWETMLAVIKLGAVMIPAASLLTSEDLRDRLERGQVRHVVTTSGQTTKFKELPGSYTRIAIGERVTGWLRYEDAESAAVSFEPDGATMANDPLLLYFTSGTTAKPKLVLHSHQSYPVGHLSTMYWIGLQPGDVHLNISSPGWAKHAWSCFFAPWNAGACVFIFNYARFDAMALLGMLERHRVTSLCAPPTVWRMLIQQDLARFQGRLALREVLGAGEPLNPEIIEQIRTAWNLQLRDGFGQTETTAQVGNSPGQPVKPGSMGRPLPGYRVILENADGRAGEEGELCLDLSLEPLGVMVGYLDSPERTQEVMRNGLYHTGDVATRDVDGYITFVGRADDVFKASDYRISPFELESVLIEHEAVVEVAVVPSPDALRLAVPKAYVILAAGMHPGLEVARALLSYARERLAPYKRVRRIEFVSELPKTISGKIRRGQLRGDEERRNPAFRAEHEYREEDFHE